MKIQVIIDIDQDTGKYELTYKSSKKGKKIEQQKLADIIQKVLDNWKLKFVD